VSYALGSVAYNEMFLAYVALFAASLYAFVLAFASVDLEALAVRFSPRMPRRSPGIFMLVSGVVVFAIWLMAPVTSLMTGKPPDRLDIYTTLFTLANALDMAVIAPASILAGLLILRQTALGYLIALALLVLEAMLAPMIAAQMVSQLSAGVELTPGLYAILRNISESTLEKGSHSGGASGSKPGDKRSGAFPATTLQRQVTTLGSRTGAAWRPSSPTPCRRRRYTMWQMLASLFLLVHGLIHLIGFIGYWKITQIQGFAYPTSPLAGRIAATPGLVRFLGVLWLVAAIGFVAGAIGLFTHQSWWRPVILIMALLSLVIRALGWPDAQMGVFINIAILVVVLLGPMLYPGTIRFHGR
jgi:hypothetical protein